ncbi:MAG: hypothetical protein A2908_04330 [Candidatus Staskawiczbacteria bacterium RIFCSPLOWO2_01_FULL_38_12b]|uniref:PABS domain-containing protein n=1 Tax=Candidatus Staskawiczbacteria bacterium RIFCSPLOWO2_01_FULL_38_12b TaxID=1802214 RepID=A0A1G2IBI3_9BACT|nr:MAG: hypothetical protein A2908_04330 [Candidatus Staskawiczbacteria bacterium RIFCSPLOWO2_01_FULL_38_12b]
MNYFSFRKITIPFFVFITGACVLIIEILATRILSPYFGNTIFSVSSIISVVLLALSMGYYTGGKLADKYPQEKLFYGIITASGLSVILLHLLGIVFLSRFGYKLSIVQGPIISAMLLFFLQSFLLGMLSPFAIKLQAMRFQTMGIGSVSGQIFFWSTFGSIFGSLSAGFFLIPNFGINKIILSIGFLLIVLGISSLLKVRLLLKVLFIITLFMGVAFFTNPAVTKSGSYTYEGVYQKITVYDGEFEKKPARFLLQDRNSSAAAFINSPDLVYEYTKYYALYSIFTPKVKEALVIGGGAYSVPKALLADLPKATIDVAEIEPSLFDISKEYFGVPNDPRLHNIVEDGRRLLSDSDKKYDFIFSDAYASLYSTPSHLTTLEFFATAKSKLNDDGIFMANVIGNLSPILPSLALSEMKTFKTVFPNSYFFATRSPALPTLQNLIFIGYNSANHINVADVNIKKNKNPIISGLAEKEIDVSTFDFSVYPVLTDDFSPVEYLTAKELERSHY